MQDTLSDKSALSPHYFANLDQKTPSIFLEKKKTTKASPKLPDLNKVFFLCVFFVCSFGCCWGFF